MIQKVQKIARQTITVSRKPCPTNAIQLTVVKQTKLKSSERNDQIRPEDDGRF